MDIMSAYRNSPLLPAHKAYVASMWHRGIYVDHCAMEGLSSAGNIQGAPADALIAIFKAKLIPHVLKWVDDFLFFRIPIPVPFYPSSPLHIQYSYDLSTIISITAPLGVPWHPVETKGQDFQPSVTYVGFVWNLDTRSVSLSCKKRGKYLAKIIHFLSKASDKVSRRECLSVHGMLQHITYVYRDGRAFLPPLSSFLSKFPNDYVCHHLPKPVIESLRWWQAILAIPCVPRSLTPQCLVDPDIWVDTSTDWGIGMVIADHWAAWKLIADWNSHGRDIGWAESIALELAVLMIVDRYHAEFRHEVTFNFRPRANPQY